MSGTFHSHFHTKNFGIYSNDYLLRYSAFLEDLFIHLTNFLCHNVDVSREDIDNQYKLQMLDLRIKR